MEKQTLVVSLIDLVINETISQILSRLFSSQQFSSFFCAVHNFTLDKEIEPFPPKKRIVLFYLD